VELTGVPLVPLPAPEGSGPGGDPWLVDAGAPLPLPLVVAVELQGEGVIGGVVVFWGGFFVP
jgi:hypothetical protein